MFPIVSSLGHSGPVTSMQLLQSRHLFTAGDDKLIKQFDFNDMNKRKCSREFKGSVSTFLNILKFIASLLKLLDSRSHGSSSATIVDKGRKSADFLWR